ncbi:hypothetical protein NDU88_004689 [Pleurodeles waltl]|uniref:Uncharacterized protein n=1 Tax=Pleurodeles waltl TaxID=8319 RepID=A0AAV7TRZ7_PLEWA|nr:hypothetical protein NDU88_004689 [Pleurodeles waltl]
MEQKKRRGGAEKLREKKRRRFEGVIENKNIFDMFTMQTKKLYYNACTRAVGSLSSDANILAIILTEHSTCKQMKEWRMYSQTKQEFCLLMQLKCNSEEESQISTSAIPAANAEEATESSAKATQVEEATRSAVSGSSVSILLPEAGIQDMTETQGMDQSQIVDIFFQRPRHGRLSEFFHPIQPSKSQQFNGQLAFMKKRWEYPILDCSITVQTLQEELQDFAAKQAHLKRTLPEEYDREDQTNEDPSLQLEGFDQEPEAGPTRLYSSEPL